MIEAKELFVPIMDEEPTKNRCPFLNDNNECVIYDQRPHICKLFGENEDDEKGLKCTFKFPEI